MSAWNNGLSFGGCIHYDYNMLVFSARFVLHARWDRGRVRKREKATVIQGYSLWPKQRDLEVLAFLFIPSPFRIKRLLTHTLLLWRWLPQAKGCRRCARFVLASCLFISFWLEALKPAQVDYIDLIYECWPVDNDFVESLSDEYNWAFKWELMLPSSDNCSVILSLGDSWKDFKFVKPRKQTLQHKITELNM